MKRILLSCLLSLFIAPVSYADCFSEGDKIIADGTLVLETFPGPPNYESIKNGDKAEKVWVVDLDGPVRCAKGAPEWGSRNKMQVIVNSTKPDIFQNKHVSVYGSLVYAETGHHRTPLLVDATSIEKYDGPNQQENGTDGSIADSQQMTTSEVCDHFLGIMGDSFGYILSEAKDENYLSGALRHAESIGLGIDYVKQILYALTHNRKDLSNAEAVYQGRKAAQTDSQSSETNYYRDAYVFMSIACVSQPAQTIPSWSYLVQNNLVKTH